MRTGWVFLCLMLVLAPTAAAYHGQPGTAGLVVEGPIDLEGALVASSSPGAAYWKYHDRFGLSLSAQSASVERVMHTEHTGLAALLQPSGIERSATGHTSPVLEVMSRGPAFQLLVFQSGQSQVIVESAAGGRVVPHPPGAVAPSLAAQRSGLSRFGDDMFSWGLRDFGARLESPNPAVRATGDFTLFVYDAMLRVTGADGAATYHAGSRSNDASRTVEYLLVHVRSGELLVAPSPGFVALYGGLLNTNVNGTAHLPLARGSAVVGGERLVANGPAALAGVLDASMYPTRDGGALRMEASGDVATLAVAGEVRDYAPPVVEVSIAVLALAALAWSIKSGGLAALYSRIAGPDVLRHGDRERSLELVRETPGLSVSEVAERLGVSWSTAAYHLSVLEREGMLVAERRGRHRRYVVNGAGADREAIAVSAHPTAQALLAAIGGEPGLTQLDLAARVGISTSTASWHLKRLSGAGLVSVRRAWRNAHYTLSGPADALAQE